MAWGFSSGLILTLNLKTCEILMQFQQDSPVDSLCFTENENLPPRLLSGSGSGNLISWNLNDSTFKCKKKLFNAPLDYLKFVVTDELSEVVLCGSHRGNGMKMMVYDHQELGEYRLLKVKQGPSGKVKKVRFLNDKHLVVLTDSMQSEIYNCWIYNDSASTKLSDKFSKSKVPVLLTHFLKYNFYFTFTFIYYSNLTLLSISNSNFTSIFI